VENDDARMCVLISPDDPDMRIETCPRPRAACSAERYGCILAPFVTRSTALRGPKTARPTRSRFSPATARTAARLSRSLAVANRLPPHQYLTSRRVDQARGLLLSGMPVADAAVGSGFYDQSHLTRHFKRILGVNPDRFRRI
jgi:AraC-like DNA-binding protein